MAFPSALPPHFIVLLQKVSSLMGLHLSMGLSSLGRGSGAPHWLGAAANRLLLISAVSCPTDPNTGHCSHLPKLHRPSSCRHTSLSPSPFGLWPPPLPCLGVRAKVQCAHSPAPCLVSGEVTGQEGPKHNHNNNKHLILWPGTEVNTFHVFSHLIFIITSGSNYYYHSHLIGRNGVMERPNHSIRTHN